jgi:spore coat polysaccharide biosynthesis predicted glycosyltransferase SpsG
VSTSTNPAEIGIVVDAGPGLGYGHAVRCVRLGRALAKRNSVVFFPLSVACKEFIEQFGFRTVSGFGTEEKLEPAKLLFPPLVITDLREAHGITAAIHRQGSRHISIHDLGLAQCHSDVSIDGSVTRLFPYADDKERELFLGPQYMITREPVPRGKQCNKVLVTLGGGSTARFADTIREQLWGMGLEPVVTRGFTVAAIYEGAQPGGELAPAIPGRRCSEIQSDAEITDAMATCRFAISGSGVTLYDLLASGVPTIAVAFDRIQLRTADAFHELGAVLSAGLLERLSPAVLLRYTREILEKRPLVQRMTEAGQTIVDGKGLSRVVDIVRRQLWLTSQVKTYTACSPRIPIASM